MKTHLHGISLEFVKSNYCSVCDLQIKNEPAIYAFQMRFTPNSTASYTHLKCVKKIPIQTNQSAIDSQSGKVLKNKPFYKFSVRPGRNVRIKASYVDTLLQKDKLGILKECLKSPNKTNKRDLLLHIGSKLAKQLGCTTEHNAANKRAIIEQSKLDAWAKITYKDIKLALAKFKPKLSYSVGGFNAVSIKDLGVSWEEIASSYSLQPTMLGTLNIKNSIKLVLVVRPRVRINGGRPVIYLHAKSSRISLKNLNKLSKFRKKLESEPTINQLVGKQSTLRGRAKYIFLVDQLRLESGVDTLLDKELNLEEVSLSALKREILQRSLSKFQTTPDNNRIGFLLLDPNPLIRKIAAEAIKKQAKQKAAYSDKDITNVSKAKELLKEEEVYKDSTSRLASGV